MGELQEHEEFDWDRVGWGIGRRGDADVIEYKNLRYGDHKIKHSPIVKGQKVHTPKWAWWSTGALWICLCSLEFFVNLKCAKERNLEHVGTNVVQLWAFELCWIHFSITPPFKADHLRKADVLSVLSCFIGTCTEYSLLSMGILPMFQAAGNIWNHIKHSGNYIQKMPICFWEDVISKSSLPSNPSPVSHEDSVSALQFWDSNLITGSSDGQVGKCSDFFDSPYAAKHITIWQLPVLWVINLQFAAEVSKYQL